jgi:HNH endonuclease
MRIKKRLPGEPISEYWQNYYAVNSLTGCHVWQKALRHGYGVLTLDSVVWQAHRLAFKLHNPNISIDGWQINHHCDNRACVNPKHLYIGTHQDNMRDAVERKRFRGIKGSSNFFAKLTEEDIPAIRARLVNGESEASIGRDYGVDHKVIGRIGKRERWAHIL